MKYRHELKFIINYREQALISTQLKSILSSDANVEVDGSYTYGVGCFFVRLEGDVLE